MFKKITIPQRTSELAYILTEPKIPQVEIKKKRLITFLHGAGERDLSDEQFETIRYMIPNNVREANYCLFPRCRPDDIFDPWEVGELINQIAKDLAVNNNYLMGYSMGARAIWSIAATGAVDITAMVVVAGYSCYLQASKVFHIPTLIFHGENDNVVPFAESAKMANAMKEFGGSPKLIPLKDFGHGPFGFIFESEKVYNWMFGNEG